MLAVLAFLTITTALVVLSLAVRALVSWLQQVSSGSYWPEHRKRLYYVASFREVLAGVTLRLNATPYTGLRDWS